METPDLYSKTPISQNGIHKMWL